MNVRTQMLVFQGFDRRCSEPSCIDVLTYKHPVLTLYGYGKFLTEGISLIF